MRPIGRIARAKADDDIARNGDTLDRRSNRHRLIDGFSRAPSGRCDPRRKRLIVDARDRSFARRVERRDDDVIGILEAAREILEQVAHARETVRLDDCDYLALGAAARRRQHGRDFRRMMAVVVVDADTVPFASELEAAFDAGEPDVA